MTTNLFNWDMPMQPPAKAKRGQPKGNAAPIGSGPAGETCGSCQNCYRVEFSKVYWKCRLVKATRGPGTDIRRKWAACSRWEKPESK
jgi:hypothetical protein